MKQLTTAELVKALREHADGACDDNCPLFKMKGGCADKMCRFAADLIEKQEYRISELESENRHIRHTHVNHDVLQILVDDNKQLKSDLETARNEICLHCGKYKAAHEGACDGCRWKEYKQCAYGIKD